MTKGVWHSVGIWILTFELRSVGLPRPGRLGRRDLPGGSARLIVDLP